MADASARTAAWLLAVVVFLIVYGTLYPFRFAAVDAGSLPALLGQLSWSRTTRSDIAANVLLYLPFGACLAWLLAPRLGGLLAALVAAVAGALLSLSIEVLQLIETRRVASLSDVTFNTIGALGGGLLALAIAGTHRRLRLSALGRVFEHPVAAALVLSWAGYRLAPFAPVIDAGKWRSAFAPRSEGPRLDPVAVLPHLLAWLVIVLAFERIARPGRAVAAAALAMGAVLLGRVLFAGLALEPSEIIGMGATLLLAPALLRLDLRRAAAALAWALVLLIAISGLAPFDFQLAQDRFALVPFGESITRYRAANLTEMFLRCFQYGSLVWLLVRSGFSVLAATLVGGGIVFTVELLQTWLPGHLADVTDPLLAVAAGGLIAVFERGTGAGARGLSR